MKKSPEELRRAEIRALKKERAANNARIKAELIARGERPNLPRPAPVGANNAAVAEMEELKKQMEQKLAHVEEIAKHKSSSNPDPIADGEVAKVRKEIGELQDTMIKMSRHLSEHLPAGQAAQNVEKLAHIQAVTCSKDKVGAAEIDRVRDEINDVRHSVRDAVSSITGAFNQYNMGMMHGTVNAIKGESRNGYHHPPPTPSPTIIVQQPAPQPLPPAPQPLYVSQPPVHAAPSVQQPGYIPQPEPKRPDGPDPLDEMLSRMAAKLDSAD